ncbi:MAG: MBL fold metallo-hydrolase RNA specificity domain-containing protein [Desulfovibrio sp.]|uniref:MBL fold metallo-hydrolase RNA specificity domain-containing protein n=1 Tax=Desulfovibrio sp. 7SRBS1 TaxID=3378064 RepID=UPI003B3F2F41
MKIKFLGAARTVTGSCYIVETDHCRFAVDCGMHQGNAAIEKRNRERALYGPEQLDFILVTHAHIDHSGLLPLMAKAGFRGNIHLTPPTKDLLEIMLLDSAHIQEMETEWENRKRQRHGKPSVEPLYDQADVQDTLPLFKPVQYDSPFQPAQGITVTYKDAGHILGSAFIVLEIEEDGKHYRLVFSGDLGRPNQLLVNNPEIVENADYLLMESTYGDRDHKHEGTSRDELAEAIQYSYSRKQKVIIPAFAVERSQEIIYSLSMLAREGKLPADMPVYLDSPLAIRATKIFLQHPEYLDKNTRKAIEEGNNPLELPNLVFTESVQESQNINETSGPAVVISASGMCNAGRIKHHLRHNLWKHGASVVFTGFQAMGTPGRKIVDGAKKIRILGEEIAVQAKIFTIGGFSAHAGQSQIMSWLSHFTNKDMKVFLVHGESRAQKALAELIRERFKLSVHIPDYLEECVLEPGEEPTVAVFPEQARPQIDWEYLLGDTERLLTELRTRMPQLQQRAWEDQADLRERLLDAHKTMLELVSEA